MALRTVKLNADLCVIGGGTAGLSAAVTAARLGLKTVIVQERPVFGGNASSEIRMWICGASDFTYREGGLAEEISLENLRLNPTKNPYIYNAVIDGVVYGEKNITALMNCTCFDAVTENNVIKSITAYQMTTQTLYEIAADYFADCSGDSITAPLTGAKFMYGREGKSEYGETMRSHTEKDAKTMGNSCLIQARRTDKKVPFHAPEWAEKVSAEKLKSKGVNLASPSDNFWYIELGGTDNVITEAENVNRRLVSLCLGIWDTIKNSGEFEADNYELEFIGFLAAKRESRRMLGDYVMTANDIESAKDFYDVAAYGGWPLDDHNPEGFDGDKSNYSIPLKKPYGIPYRCMYSQNIENLFFAGRNVSMTHMAISSARVMGTCISIGQAVGAASYVAHKYGVSPRGALERVNEIQQILLTEDCFLPGVKRNVASVCKNARFFGAEVLRNGVDRDLPEETNGATICHGEQLVYSFDKPTDLNGVKIVFDSDFKRESYEGLNFYERHRSSRCNTLGDEPLCRLPKTLVKSYKVVIEDAFGKETEIAFSENNAKRNVVVRRAVKALKVKLVITENYGGTDSSKLFTFEVF